MATLLDDDVLVSIMNQYDGDPEEGGDGEPVEPEELGDVEETPNDDFENDTD